MYSTWLFPYIYLSVEMNLHVAAPRWQVDIPYEVEYGEVCFNVYNIIDNTLDSK